MRDTLNRQRRHESLLDTLFIIKHVLLVLIRLGYFRFDVVCAGTAIMLASTDEVDTTAKHYELSRKQLEL